MSYSRLDRCRRALHLAGKKVVGASAGHRCPTAWTEAGELFISGLGYEGKLGHGGTQNELVPRLVEAFSGKQVIGAALAVTTVVWTEAGELFTFGAGDFGQVGHSDGECDVLVPRLVEGL